MSRNCSEPVPSRWYGPSYHYQKAHSTYYIDLHYSTTWCYDAYSIGFSQTQFTWVCGWVDPNLKTWNISVYDTTLTILQYQLLGGSFDWSQPNQCICSSDVTAPTGGICVRMSLPTYNVTVSRPSTYCSAAGYTISGLYFGACYGNLLSALPQSTLYLSDPANCKSCKYCSYGPCGYNVLRVRFDCYSLCTNEWSTALDSTKPDNFYNTSIAICDIVGYDTSAGGSCWCDTISVPGQCFQLSVPNDSATLTAKILVTLSLLLFLLF